MPVAARSKASVWGRSLAGIAGLNAAGVYGRLSLVSVVCCQVEVCATGRSLVQRSHAECVRLRYREASKMRRFNPTGACCALERDVIGCVLSRVASVRCALFFCHGVAQ